MFLYIFFGQCCEAIRWRVCNQQDLYCIVQFLNSYVLGENVVDHKLVGKKVETLQSFHAIPFI